MRLKKLLRVLFKLWVKKTIERMSDTAGYRGLHSKSPQCRQNLRYILNTNSTSQMSFAQKVHHVCCHAFVVIHASRVAF